MAYYSPATDTVHLCYTAAMTASAVPRWAAVVVLSIAGAVLLTLAPHWGARDIVLYNHSPSIPAGFYVRSRAPIARGAIVTVRARDVAPALAAARRFTDAGDRFIKRVAAVHGDVVCAEGETLRINGAEVARRLQRDSEGHALPSWSGCRALAMGEVLLLGDTPDSFDGRYWGPVSLQTIEGVWRPLNAAQQ